MSGEDIDHQELSAIRGWIGFRTAEGAGVGSTESEVAAAFGDQVTKTPGEYGNWYVTVEADENRQEPFPQRRLG